MTKGSTVIWEGRSQLDHSSPVVAVVTGLAKASDNPKTGRMAQLWILRADKNPLAALQDRSDDAICGDCKLRGDSTKTRSCYVSVRQAPYQVFNAYDRGSYDRSTPTEVNRLLRDKGLSIRLGAYGDPVALPLHVLQDLTADVRHTGYTHQWRQSAEYIPYLMASVDDAAEYAAAKHMGWRTFRCRTVEEKLFYREIVCPASDEAGHRTTCERCLLCDGKNFSTAIKNQNHMLDRRSDISIIVHGTLKAQFVKLTRRV